MRNPSSPVLTESESVFAATIGCWSPSTMTSVGVELDVRR